MLSLIELFLRQLIIIKLIYACCFILMSEIFTRNCLIANAFMTSILIVFFNLVGACTLDFVYTLFIHRLSNLRSFGSL